MPAEVIELVAEARREFRYGASRTWLWLMRVHDVKVATKTITSICNELGLGPVQTPRRRRAPRQLKLFERPHPGDCVQVDVKVVKIAGRKCFQYTALDDCTRLRVLRLYPQQAEPDEQPRVPRTGATRIPVPDPTPADG